MKTFVDLGMDLDSWARVGKGPKARTFDGLGTAIALALGMLVQLAAAVGVAVVAYHFIVKFW